MTKQRTFCQGRQIMIQAPTHQIPGVYHRRIGDIIVTALLDGYQTTRRGPAISSPNRAWAIATSRDLSRFSSSG